MQLDPAGRAAALQAASELFAATRAQPGCLDYVWCADPGSESRVYVYERWSDTASLAAHLAGPCYRGMLEVLAPARGEREGSGEHHAGARREDTSASPPREGERELDVEQRVQPRAEDGVTRSEQQRHQQHRRADDDAEPQRRGEVCAHLR